jgi:hypothetical protein
VVRRPGLNLLTFAAVRLKWILPPLFGTPIRDSVAIGLSLVMPKPRIRNSKAVAFNVTREEYKRPHTEFRIGGAYSLADPARNKAMRGLNRDSLAGVARFLGELDQAVRQLGGALRTNGVSHGR